MIQNYDKLSCDLIVAVAWYYIIINMFGIKKPIHFSMIIQTGLLRSPFLIILSAKVMYCFSRICRVCILGIVADIIVIRITT